MTRRPPPGRGPTEGREGDVMNLKEHAAMCLWQNKACAWQGRAERAEAEVERLRAAVATLADVCRHTANEIRRAAVTPGNILYGLGSIADTLDAALAAADGGGE
jgi:hypothetical protein